MTEQYRTDSTRKVPTFGLSATQLVATGLAATTATFAASYLGIAGTVIGAALASVLTAVGNAVYGQSLRRTRERVRDAVPIARTRSMPVVREPASLHDPDESEAAHQQLRPAPSNPPAGPPWRRVAIAALGVFVTIMAVVTSVELVAGRPVSDLARGDSGAGTTFFGGTVTSSTPASTSAPTPGSTPTVYITVTPEVVITTPTITRTAPAATATLTAPASGTPAGTPTGTSSATSTAPGASPTPSPSSTP